ncbi:unnamed protein product [Haemonchus placei]|uniref:Metallophos domain-containing protein n=1 Tax=Haemonchus placei TaxID=6290 RepID=A0A158QR21_HAEPC|nr:unnamed protein product [Haemonchus placei]
MNGFVLPEIFTQRWLKNRRKLCGQPSTFPTVSLKETFFKGNHEYMHGNVEEWFAFLENCNITVLHNSYKRFVTKKGDHFCIAGADDLYAAKVHFPGHAMQPERAVSGCALNDTTIMLAHQPNAAKLMLSHPLVSEKLDLILSGHTHGGQMYLFVPIIYLANAFGTRGIAIHKVFFASVNRVEVPLPLFPTLTMAFQIFDIPCLFCGRR